MYVQCKSAGSASCFWVSASFSRRRLLVGNTTIQGLLDTLTEDQRNTLSLHFFEGYTFDELADERGFLNTLHPIGSIQIP
jgi:hypothetical protein